MSALNVSLVHQAVRPLIVAALKAYSSAYNAAGGCFEPHTAPAGVDADKVLVVRYCQSIYETVVLLACDGRDYRLDVHQHSNVAGQWGANLAREVRAAAEALGAPTRDDIQRAANAAQAALEELRRAMVGA